MADESIIPSLHQRASRQPAWATDLMRLGSSLRFYVVLGLIIVFALLYGLTLYRRISSMNSAPLNTCLTVDS